MAQIAAVLRDAADRAAFLRALLPLRARVAGENAIGLLHVPGEQRADRRART